jgi:hypothetical protein
VERGASTYTLVRASVALGQRIEAGRVLPVKTAIGTPDPEPRKSREEILARVRAVLGLKTMAGNVTMLVRFLDGTIRFGHYQATADVPGCRLYETAEEVKAQGNSGWFDEPEHDPSVPEVEVELYVPYGGGFHWSGRARGLWLVDSGHRCDERDPFSHWIEGLQDGTPDWVPEEFR